VLAALPYTIKNEGWKSIALFMCQSQFYVRTVAIFAEFLSMVSILDILP
jgi:hypothetical protein